MALFGIYIDEPTDPPARRPTGYLQSVNAETAEQALDKYKAGKAVFMPVIAVPLNYEMTENGTAWSPVNGPSLLVYLEDDVTPEEAQGLKVRIDRGETIKRGRFQYRKRA
jgi:hypothetical protein